MRVMWIIAIHRKTYPNYHFRAISDSLASTNIRLASTVDAAHGSVQLP